MAEVTTPEESARKILATFIIYFNGQPDHVLQLNSLLSRGMSLEDFNNGAEYAIKMGWIEKTIGNQYKLGDSGFTEFSK